jgi:hypothetical protein
MNPSGVQFVRENSSGWPLILHGQVKQRLTYYTSEQLKELALQFFRLTPEMAAQVAEFRVQKGILGPFDIGVHIRTGDKITTGEMKAIPVSAYVDQIRRTCKSPSPRIFIMTDNFEMIRQLQALADPSWQLFSYTLDRQKGHVQLDFNLSPAAQRKTDYIQFLAELQVMQETPALLVTYSSNIGRYLYLTTPKSTSITSLDVKSFVAA